VASTSGPGSKPPLTPILDGFGKPDGKRDAAMTDYGKQLESADFELADDVEDPNEMARRAAGKPAASPPARPTAPRPAIAAKPAPPKPLPEIALADSDVRPTLEPISETTHKHRRIPTQPPSALELELDVERPAPERPAARPATAPAPPPSSARSPSPTRPPGLASRQSPAPVRRGLFSGDRITNMLASAAVGVVIMIYPAKQLAHSYEVRTVEPMLVDLEGAIDHPLGVQAGLIAEPDKIAAQIHDGRDEVRRRYMMIWLLVGLPLGLGLGFIPRPGD
jgi:hypothetical protein